MVGMSGRPERPGGWRWTAHPPGQPPRGPVRAPIPRHRLGPAWLDRTPGYDHVPRWGLPPVTFPGAPPAEMSPSRTERLAERAFPRARSAAFWTLLAAAVQLLRYAMLVAFADRVVPLWAEAIATAAVWVVGGMAALMCAYAAIAAAAWLVVTRRRAYAPTPDPRGTTSIWLRCLVPVVSLVGPAVLLRELDLVSPRGGPRLRARITRWWAAWLLDWALLAVLAWRASDGGTQAAADCVLLAALVQLAATWVARETAAVIRSSDGPGPGFTRRLLARGIVTDESQPPAAERPTVESSR